MDLSEWTVIYLKQKDALRQQIEHVEYDNYKVTVTNKDQSKIVVLINEKLQPNKIANIIVCKNTKQNVEELAKNWKKYYSNEELTIIFANPTTNQKWLIKPHLHHKIADQKNLRQGLMSMFDSAQKS